MSIILFFTIGGGTCHSSEIDDEALSELGALSIECIDRRQVFACQSALLYAEALQRQAALNGNYSCQTRLLGLGADLSIASLQSGNGRSVIKMLEEAKLYCSGSK